MIHTCRLSFLVLLGCLGSYGVELRCYHKTFDNYTTASIDNVQAIVSCVNKTLDTYFYVFGLGGSATGTAVENVVKVLLLQFNVILLEWSKEAKINTILGTSLSYASYAAPNAMAIGCKLGKTLADLSKNGLDSSKLKLLGHSLGAHLCGQAGRCAQQAGLDVSRITGLDPSGPLFGTLGPFPALDKNCATFVDIIHTDPCGLGTNRSTGTVDIYPNYSRDCPHKQSGCPEGNYGPDDMSIPARCSHDRAWQLYCDGTRYPGSLPANSATCGASGNGNTNIAYIGPYTNLQASGDVCLETNSASPYGRGLDGLQPQMKK